MKRLQRHGDLSGKLKHLSTWIGGGSVGPIFRFESDPSLNIGFYAQLCLGTVEMIFGGGTPDTEQVGHFFDGLPSCGPFQALHLALAERDAFDR